MEDGSRLAAVRRYVRQNWLALFSAFVLGLGFPLWKMLVVEQPDVYVEVTDIDKRADGARIDISKDPDFKFLVGESPEDFEFAAVAIGARRAEVDVEELRRLIDTFADSTERLTARIDSYKKRRDEIQNAPLTLDAARRANGPLLREVNIDPTIFTQNNVAAIADMKNELLARYDETIQGWTESMTTRRQTVERTRAELEKRLQTMNLREARVRIDCAVSNSGGGGISMKPQGLLRVYLGGNNYFDVPVRILKLDGEPASDAGELAARASKSITFVSDQLQEMRRGDQDRINTYFRQNVPAKLFLIDIRGNAYSSNVVPFAKGLYEQTVFDRLSAEASKLQSPQLK